MVYLDGTVWLMSPAFPHERLRKRLGWVVEVIVEELDIPCIAAASTTFRRRAKRGGVEGDQTYYLANEERVRGKDKLHLKTDPPPDLAIEAVHSHDADAAIEVYRRFKVPEVWVCDEDEMRDPGSSAERPICRVDHECGFPVSFGGRSVRMGATAPDRVRHRRGSSSSERGSSERSSRASDGQDQDAMTSRTKSNKCQA